MRGRKPKENKCRVCSDDIQRSPDDGKLTHERICKLCHGERIFKQLRKNVSNDVIDFQIKKYKRLVNILEQIKKDRGES